MGGTVSARACEPTVWLPEGSPSPVFPQGPAAPECEPGLPDVGRGDGAGTSGLWNKTIDVHCDNPEALSIRERSVGDAVMAEIAAPPLTVTQDSAGGDNPHRFHLVLLIEGYGVYRWADGTVTQRPGDVVLMDTTESSQVIADVDNRVLRWSFPERLIAPFLPASDSLAVLHLPARDGLMTVLARHIRELAREADQLDGNAQQGLLAHLCGLLGLAIEAEKTSRPARRCTYRFHQRQRILTYIETHLDNCGLTAKRAARELGMSPRWLHALLEDAGIGFADLVAHRRLEKGFRLLEASASNHLSIAEVAFRCGFNDLSTFYRRFGERYGATPGEVRRKGLQAA